MATSLGERRGVRAAFLKGNQGEAWGPVRWERALKAPLERPAQKLPGFAKHLLFAALCRQCGQGSNKVTLTSRGSCPVGGGHTRVCTIPHMHTHVHTCTCVHTCTHITRAHTHTHTHITRTHAHVYTHITHTHIYTSHAHTHIHTSHAHTHVYTHYMHTCAQGTCTHIHLDKVNIANQDELQNHDGRSDNESYNRGLHFSRL